MRAKVLETNGYQAVTLHDQSEEHRQPNRDNIEHELLQICKSADADDLLLVYFACHGILADGKPILIAKDTRRHLIQKRGFPVSEVESIMKQSKARRLVLLLDACHSGVGRDSPDPEFIKNVHDLAEGFALIAASTSEQVAQEWEDMEHGVFSHYLMEGLSGQADRNAKKFVTVDDLKNHVLDGLKKWTLKHSGMIQEPTAKIAGMGDMILADFRECENHFSRAECENHFSHTEIKNPFHDTGRITDPARFFDREDLLRRIFEELGKGGNISLVGDTQVGKSSVLSMICASGPERLGLSKESFVYLSMELVETEDDFYDALCDKMGFEETLRGYKLVKALSKNRHILCLDEIELMNEGGFSLKTRSYLRGLADNPDIPLNLVIASRSPLDDLFPDSPDQASPLANICMKMDVGPFSVGDASAFLAHRLRETGVSFSESETGDIISKTGGHPAKMRDAARALFETRRNRQA